MALAHRLIIFTGASFGAGKSTLAVTLAGQLAERGIANRLWTEGDLLSLPPLARFDRELGDNNPRAIEAFRSEIRELFAVDNAGEQIWITDALLPGFFWLFGRYATEHVEAFGAELAQLLRPWQPLIVFLDGEAAPLFDRAIVARGQEWGRRMVAAIERWDLPHYPNRPIQGQSDVVRFFDWLSRQTLGLLAQQSWEVLRLDALNIPAVDHTVSLMRYLTATDTGITG